MSQTSQTPFSDPAAFIGNPRPVVALTSDYPAGYEIAPHRHERAQLVYASEGVMTVATEAGRWVVPPQRAVWVPAGLEHAVTINRRARMHSLYITPRAAEPLPANCRVVAVSPLLRALILRAMAVPALYDEAGPDGRILAVILDELSALSSTALHLPRPRDPRLARVTEALRADPADQRGLDAWATVAGASPRTLARLFVKDTGLTFRAWRLRARLLKALVELAAERPVTAVSFEAGYDSPSAFIAAFKREFGTTPSRYFRTDGA